MPDDPTPDGQAEASAPAPAAAPDIEKIKADLRQEMAAEMDTRIAGFQTVINRLTEENRGLKTATLSEDEREQLMVQERDEYIAELEAQLKLTQLSQPSDGFDSRVYSLAYQAYTNLLNASTEEEQMSVLLSLVQPAAPTAPDAPEPSDVDKNNPSLSVGQIVAQLPGGGPIDGDQALEALKQLGPTPLGSR